METAEVYVTDGGSNHLNATRKCSLEGEESNFSSLHHLDKFEKCSSLKSCLKTNSTSRVEFYRCLQKTRGPVFSVFPKPISVNFPVNRPINLSTDHYSSRKQEVVRVISGTDVWMSSGQIDTTDTLSSNYTKLTNTQISLSLLASIRSILKKRTHLILEIFFSAGILLLCSLVQLNNTINQCFAP